MKHSVMKHSVIKATLNQEHVFLLTAIAGNRSSIIEEIQIGFMAVA